MTFSPKRNLLITGANKGIGYGIVKKLLADLTPYNIIFTSRTEKAGQQALEILKANYPNSVSTLICHQLDVTDPNSIENLASWYQKNFGKLEVLINNAGAVGGNTTEGKETALKTNYFGVLAMNEKFLPLLSDDAKIINISSTMGQLSEQDERLRGILSDENLTEIQLNETAESVLEIVKDSDSSFGIYPATKALLNTYIRRVLPEKVKAGQQIYAVHPGWVKPEAGGPDAPLSVEEAANDIMSVINLPFKRDERFNGKFIHKMEVISW